MAQRTQVIMAISGGHLPLARAAMANEAGPQVLLSTDPCSTDGA